MELPGGGDEWLAPSPSPPGPAVPDRHDEHGVGTFIWPPAGTSTWPPVGTFSWPRTTGEHDSAGIVFLPYGTQLGHVRTKVARRRLVCLDIVHIAADRIRSHRLVRRVEPVG